MKKAGSPFLVLTDEIEVHFSDADQNYEVGRTKSNERFVAHRFPIDTVAIRLQRAMPNIPFRVTAIVGTRQPFLSKVSYVPPRQ